MKKISISQTRAKLVFIALIAIIGLDAYAIYKGDVSTAGLLSAGLTYLVKVYVDKETERPSLKEE